MAELMLIRAGVVHLQILVATARTLTSMVTSTEASPTLWYLTRAFAIAAYTVLTLSVALGVLQSIARRSGEHLSWLADELHQFLATLTGVLVVGHLVTLLLDPFLPFSVANLLLPLQEPYRPFPVELGVYALYGMVLLLFTSWLRRRVPYGLWRAVHYVSFLTFGLVTAHGLLTGSDAQEPWMRAVYAFAAGSIGFVTLMRLFFSRPPKAARPAKSRAG
jgi:predicted ferric reductase